MHRLCSDLMVHWPRHIPFLINIFFCYIQMKKNINPLTTSTNKLRILLLLLLFCWNIGKIELCHCLQGWQGKYVYLKMHHIKSGECKGGPHPHPHQLTTFKTWQSEKVLLPLVGLILPKPNQNWISIPHPFFCVAFHSCHLTYSASLLSTSISLLP